MSQSYDGQCSGIAFYRTRASHDTVDQSPQGRSKGEEQRHPVERGDCGRFSCDERADSASDTVRAAGRGSIPRNRHRCFRRGRLGRAPEADEERSLATGYSTFDRELLAMSLVTRRVHVEGRPLTFYTDHDPLTLILVGEKTPLSARQHRHLSFIAELISDIAYICGQSTVVANALSRPPATNSVFLCTITLTSPMIEKRSPNTRRVTEQVQASCGPRVGRRSADTSGTHLALRRLYRCCKTVAATKVQQTDFVAVAYPA